MPRYLAVLACGGVTLMFSIIDDLFISQLLESMCDDSVLWSSMRRRLVRPFTSFSAFFASISSFPTPSTFYRQVKLYLGSKLRSHTHTGSKYHTQTNFFFHCV